MFSRIFFFLVIVCVVNASVLTVNGFDDDLKTEAASNPKDCSPQACHQLCRRLKFPSGTCVNGRCKCDNFLNGEGDISEENPSDIEDLVALNDDPEAEVAPNRRCRDKACDWLCRAFNKTSGACADGRCKCTKTVAAEDDPEVAAAPSRCRDKACDSVCRLLNNTSGACVDGRCKCTKSVVAEVYAFDENSEFDERLGCRISKCNRTCTRLGYDSATCVNRRCKCYNKTQTQDDISETKLPASELSEDQIQRGCNLQACHQLCRRLKFPGGTCVNSRCKCDNFLNGEEDMSEEEPSDLEELVSLYDDPEAEVAPNRRCRDKACDWLCRAFNKTSGACADGRCKCTKTVVAEDAFDDDSELDERRVCRILKCNRTCTRLGYDSATCVNRRCKCYNKTQTQDNISERSIPVSEMSEDQIERGCNPRACDQSCRRLKFPGGACVNGRCKCDNFLNGEEDMSEEERSDLEELVSLYDDLKTEAASNPKDCSPQACHQLCRRLKFPSGTCVNGRCKCDNFLNGEDDPEAEVASNRRCRDRACDWLCRAFNKTSGACADGRCKCTKPLVAEDAFDDDSEVDERRVCRISKCNGTCTRLGYDSATCVNRRCKCYNKTQTQDNISERSIPVSEMSEDQIERGCNPRACDQSCRRLKFPGGACVNGRCKCDKFFGAEDAVDEYSESATRRVCNLRQCNRTCSRRGYERARCVNGWCNCYNKIKGEDASPLNEVTYNNEETNETSETNEVVSDASPRACNTPTCNVMCHRLKYAGGWCRFGQCQCY